MSTTLLTLNNKKKYILQTPNSTKKQIWNVRNNAKSGKFYNSGRNIVIKWEVWLVESIDQIHGFSLVSKEKCLKFQLNYSSA